MKGIGAHVFGAPAMLLGATVAIGGDFATNWQPVPEDWPAHGLLVFAGAAFLFGGGLAVQWPRTRPGGGAVLASVFFAFTLLWVRRVVGFPQIFGTWLGTAEELALVLGACALFLPFLAGPTRQAATETALRLAFGVCALIFGIAHFLYVKETAAMVPRWLPPGPDFWTYVTGAGHAAAGLALVTGILALTAVRLLTLMFLVFQAMVWLPQLVARGSEAMAWGGNGVNLALVGAAWIVADMIAARAKPLPAAETEAA